MTTLRTLVLTSALAGSALLIASGTAGAQSRTIRETPSR